MAPGPMNSILVITVRIRESVPDHDPDPERTATILLCWRSAEVCAFILSISSFFLLLLGQCLSRRAGVCTVYTWVAFGASCVRVYV